MEKARKAIEALITKYAKVREEFEKIKENYPEYLAGNDNYIGIIGEYWAKVFLESLPENMGIEIKNSSSEGNKSEKWVDFKIDRNGKQEDINVKAISSENKKQESGKIKLADRDKEHVCSIIVVKLNEQLHPEELLYIKDIDFNLDLKKVRYKSKPQCEIYFKYIQGEGFENIYKDYIYIYDNNNKEFKLKFDKE